MTKQSKERTHSLQYVRISEKAMLAISFVAVSSHVSVILFLQKKYILCSTISLS